MTIPFSEPRARPNDLKPAPPLVPLTNNKRRRCRTTSRRRLRRCRFPPLVASGARRDLGFRGRLTTMAAGVVSRIDAGLDRVVRRMLSRYGCILMLLRLGTFGFDGWLPSHSRPSSGRRLNAGRHRRWFSTPSRRIAHTAMRRPQRAASTPPYPRFATAHARQALTAAATSAPSGVSLIGRPRSARMSSRPPSSRSSRPTAVTNVAAPMRSSRAAWPSVG